MPPQKLSINIYLQWLIYLNIHSVVKQKGLYICLCCHWLWLCPSVCHMSYVTTLFGCMMLQWLWGFWGCVMESVAVILPWDPDYQCKAKSTPEAEAVGVLVETMIRNLFIWQEMFQEIILHLKWKPTCAALYLTSAYSELRLTLQETWFWTKINMNASFFHFTFMWMQLNCRNKASTVIFQEGKKWCSRLIQILMIKIYVLGD